MICIACGQPTESTPCSHCGEEPRLDGRWSLTQLLGQGANGTTWKAVDADGFEVAAKESTLRTTDPLKVRELVEREARVLRQLEHPGVPGYVEEHWHQSGRTRSLFLLQEYVDGVDLQRRMQDHRYDEAEVVDVLEEVAGVLAYLHGRSPPIVHRDIKPSNVMRTAEGRHVLLDFGSVRDVLKDAQLGGSTVAGTFGYMAPEQFAGDASPVSDLYGLGALAVALLTRQDPAQLQNPDRSIAWRRHARVSEPMARLVDELLALDPSKRPQSADEVIRRLGAVRAGDEASEPPEPTPRPAPAPTPAPTPLAPGYAERPTDPGPAPFHQPPVLHQDAPLQPPSSSTSPLLLTVAALAILAISMIAFVVIGGAGLFVVRDVDTPPPIATSLPAKTVQVSPSPWPVMTAAELQALPASPTCTIRILPSADVDVLDCSGALAQQALDWINNSVPNVDQPVEATISFVPRPPDTDLLVVETTHELEDAGLDYLAPERSVTMREQPAYPPDVDGVARVRCSAEVFVGPDGAPDRLVIDGCPRPFHQATTTALYEWRWEPGEPFRTDVGITFRKDTPEFSTRVIH